MLSNSIWKGTAIEYEFPTLKGNLTVDVAVIGGGITGITTALCLMREGRRVAVIEARKVGMGNTGESTGNLYATIDTHLYALEKRWNSETMQEVVNSRREAINFIDDTISEYQISCDFVRCPWMLFTGVDNSLFVETITKEYEAARSAGLAATLMSELNFPRPVEKGVMVEGQAQFHPTNYVRGLAKAINSETCRIFENSSVIDIKPASGSVICGGATITAEQIVSATHTPKGVNILQSEMKANRLYGMAATVKNLTLPPGIYWEIGLQSPRSVRVYQNRGETYVMVIGEKHQVGHQEDTEKCYRNLENYLRENFPVEEIRFQWSGQHYVPADSIPYIGASPHSGRVYIATGFSTDGLTYGALSGMILADQIVGKPDRWSGLYKSRRFTPLKSARQIVELNVDVVKNFVQDYVLNKNLRSLANLQNGEGSLVEMAGKKLAAYRDEKGELTVLSSVCPHMKCQVHWNAGERSWDCPCHGSRFDINGAIIEGPAMSGLERAEIPPEQVEQDNSKRQEKEEVSMPQ